MTRIRKHTAAIHRRNIRKAETKAYITVANPANVFILNQVLDIIF